MTRLFRVDESGSATHLDAGGEDMLEKALEELLLGNPHMVLGERLFFIGRQVRTDANKVLDLVGVNRERCLVVVELKRGMAPRDVIAQVLDYSSWLVGLPERKLEAIARSHFEATAAPYRSLAEAYRTVFGCEPMGPIGEDVVNVLFAADFSPEVMRPAEYLSERGIPIRCVQFERFAEKGGGSFFVIRRLVGDDDEPAEVSGAGVAEPPPPLRHFHRNLMKQLQKEFEAKYGDWLQSQSIERLAPFSVYQSRDSTWTCIYQDWLYPDGTKLAMDIALWWQKDVENQPVLLASEIFARRRSQVLTERFGELGRSGRLLDGFEDRSENVQPRFRMTAALNDVTYGAVAAEAHRQMERLRSVMDALLPKEERPKL